MFGDQFWFKSDLFKVQKGEDKDTNPGYYGKSLAEWLCNKFIELGYDADVIPEDWGWCVRCVYGEYLLWIGCGPMQTEIIPTEPNSDPPNERDIVWHVFTVIEVPFFMLKSIFRKLTGKLDLLTPLQKLNSELRVVLSSEKGIVFCEEP